MKAICKVCARRCALEEGQTGFCRARINLDGRVVCKNYGRVTSLALDPIEKKPLLRFYPGSRILSAGSFGCNFACPFCQNHEISMTDGRDIRYEEMRPEELVKEALAWKGEGNIGLAYTYNEPLVGYEYVRDCAMLARKQGLKNVVVTNGSVSTEVLAEILPYVDAFNIDLKGFSQRFYRMVQGNFEDVRAFIRMAAQGSHVEITTLVIPGENDSEEEIDALAAWIKTISPDIPLHLSRFFPRYRMQDKKETSIETVSRLAGVAEKHLNYVYKGNC